MFRIFFSGMVLCFCLANKLPAIKAAESSTFYATSDSHYEAVEQTEGNDRNRRTISETHSLLASRDGFEGDAKIQTSVDWHWKTGVSRPNALRSPILVQFSPTTPIEAKQVQSKDQATETQKQNTVKFAVIGDFGLDNYKPKTNAKSATESVPTLPASAINKSEANEHDDDEDEKLAQSAFTPFQSSQQQRNPFEAAVAKLVKSWQPDFVVTTGDNNYPKGEASTIDDNIGKYYSDFIGNYHGVFGKGAATNRFFPVLGNHDWYASKVGCQAHLDYFEFQQGPLHFFMLDNDAHEPDGVKPGTKQYHWFEKATADSKAPFQIVVAHHPPFSSGEHGDDATAQWDYAKHGVDLLLAGHDHNYERIERAGLTYVVNGAGGANLRRFKKIVEGSRVRYNAKHGAMLMETEQTSDAWLLHGRFVNIDGEEVDHFTLKQPLK
jgi:predicted phosphodiesterase